MDLLFIKMKKKSNKDKTRSRSEVKSTPSHRSDSASVCCAREITQPTAKSKIT